MRDFAKRLIAYEARGNHAPGHNAPGDFDICEKLRPQLVTLMGNAGFRALLSRALALAGDEAPWLRAVHVKSDGALEGLEEMHAELPPGALLEGKVALLAQLLGLLVAFIGQNLTVRVIREVWPKAPLNDLDLANGEKNEKPE